MKCINKFRIQTAVCLLILLLTGCSLPVSSGTDYERNLAASHTNREQFFAEDLCVSDGQTVLDGYTDSSSFHASLLFDKTDRKVLLSHNVHKKLYPASTTKIITLYLALKYGNLEDTVTVSKNAVSVPSDSSVAGLREGDTLLLKDLLYGLMLPSGNDAAVAVAEHISGTTKDFVSLMNEEAEHIGATNTHFMTPHGYQDENHYTTAYDLYLLLNEAVTMPEFCEIVGTAEHHAKITDAAGQSRTMDWLQSNQFINGTKEVPEGVNIVGGKTGTTDEAGACLTLYVRGDDEHEYFAILMGAPDKIYLYDSMYRLLSMIPQITK